METAILYYLKHCAEDKNIKSNEYRLLSYFSFRFIDELSYEINTSIRSIDSLNMSYPTVLKALDGLEFMGMIEVLKRGAGNQTVIRLVFMESIIDKNGRVTETGKKYLPDETSVSYIGGISRGDINAKSYKETYNRLPDRIKESLTRSDFGIKNLSSDSEICYKNLYNQFSICCKNLYNQNGSYKDSLRQNGSVYKILIHYIFPFNPLSGKDLVTLRKNKYKQISDFLARKGTIYNTMYIQLLDIVDLTAFGGELFRFIENVEKSEQQTFSSKEKKNKPFEIDSDTVNEIPDSLRSTPGFVDRYKEWLEYRRVQKDSPVGYFTAKEEFAMLKNSEDPIRDISFSIRVGAKNLIMKDYSSEDNNGDSDNGLGFTIK